MRASHLIFFLLFVSCAVSAQTPAESPAGGLFLRSTTGAVRPATRLTADIDIEVSGIVARVNLQQRFRNDSNDWVEGIYLFPLPDDAAVDKLVMVIGDRRIEGEIQEREQARQTYQRARDAGQQASLVEQQRPNLFTTELANIAPGQEVVVEIGFSQTASYQQGEFSLRLPLTLTPRFVPGAISPDAEGRGGARAPSQIANASRISAPRVAPGTADTQLASMQIMVDAGMPLAEIGSPSHALSSSYDGRHYRLSTGARQIPMDRDFVVSWQMVPDQTPRVASFAETLNGERYVLLMFMPPGSVESIDPTPRETIFVIDTSGSMGGESIRQARSALLFGLDRLSPLGRFNVIEFNNEARALFSAPERWNEQSLLRARRFVAGLAANGGTNIASALDLALGQPAGYGSLRQVVFITDGSVGNEAELFRKIGRDLGESRLFTVGIGSAPNTHFMRKAAQFGRGSYSHISQLDDVEPRMRQLFDKLQHLSLTDIAIDWPGATEIYPERVPDLYHGEPVIVTARADAGPGAGLAAEATGLAGNLAWSERISVRPGESAGVAALWARRKIEALLDRRLDGEQESAIRAAVLDVALEHGLLSPYTSLVAVDRTPERTRNAQLRRQAVGNLPPSGSTARYAVLPGTATDSRWYQLIGTVLAGLLLGLISIWVILRRART